MRSSCQRLPDPSVINVRKKSSAAARRTRSGVRAASCGPARIALTDSPPVTRATADAAKPRCSGFGNRGRAHGDERRAGHLAPVVPRVAVEAERGEVPLRVPAALRYRNPCAPSHVPGSQASLAWRHTWRACQALSETPNLIAEETHAHHHLLGAARRTSSRRLRRLGSRPVAELRPHQRGAGRDPDRRAVRDRRGARARRPRPGQRQAAEGRLHHARAPGPLRRHG